MNGDEDGVVIVVGEEVGGIDLSWIRFFFMLKSNVPFSSTSISAPLARRLCGLLERMSVASLQRVERFRMAAAAAMWVSSLY